MARKLAVGPEARSKSKEHEMAIVMVNGGGNPPHGEALDEFVWNDTTQDTNSGRSMPDVTDGTSNTLMVGERYTFVFEDNSQSDVDLHGIAWVSGGSGTRGIQLEDPFLDAAHALPAVQDVFNSNPGDGSGTVEVHNAGTRLLLKFHSIPAATTEVEDGGISQQVRATGEGDAVVESNYSGTHLLYRDLFVPAVQDVEIPIHTGWLLV
jgi:hypothetical protein